MGNQRTPVGIEPTTLNLLEGCIYAQCYDVAWYTVVECRLTDSFFAANQMV